MAVVQSTPLRTALRKLFPDAVLLGLARETGAVRRSRKIDIVALFWTVVLGFGVGRTRCLAAFRCTYQKLRGQELAPSSFFDRFTDGFARLLQRAAEQALRSTCATGAHLRGALAAFADVVVADATVVRLHDLLAHVYPGTRTNQNLAAVKLHLVHSVTGAGRGSVRLTGERVHDGKVLPVGPWVRGCLLLFDLGYFGYRLFARIHDNGGFIVTRLKARTNPKIVAVNRRHRGRAIDLVGCRLRDIDARLRRDVLDADVTVCFKRRTYAGRSRGDSLTLRLIALRHPATDELRYYLTNAPVDTLAAEDIAAVYAARWQVELLFAQLKSLFRLDQVASRKPQVVHALLWAAVLSLLAADQLRRVVLRRSRLDDASCPRQRWARLFARIAEDLLRLVLSPPRQVAHLNAPLLKLLRHEAPDPNRNRPGLLETIGLRRHRCQSNGPFNNANRSFESR
jgi:putative transposase